MKEPKSQLNVTLAHNFTERYLINIPKVNQVKALFELPWLIGILYCEDAIGRHPCLWRWIEVYSLDDSTRKLVRHILGPSSIASTNVEDVLDAIQDWCAEEIVLLLRVENQMHDVCAGL